MLKDFKRASEIDSFQKYYYLVTSFQVILISLKKAPLVFPIVHLHIFPIHLLCSFNAMFQENVSKKCFKTENITIT